MGFMDEAKKAMKTSYSHKYGIIASPFFPPLSYLFSDSQGFYIDQAGIVIGGPKFERYPVRKEDIEVWRFLGCGGSWVRYWIKFKDGKTCFLTADVTSPSLDDQKRSSGGVVGEIECYFGDIISFR
ncbi:MAG: hypothetical protein IJL73_05345 [Lachnospiraceae bacterium]|nr:hypothetical protein [Lachnospiraceae bacterium]